MSKFSEVLAKAAGGREEWESARTKTSGFEEVKLPQGNYTARVTKTKTGINKNGDPYFMLFFSVTDGEFKGKRPSSYISLKDIDAIERGFQTLRSLGLETEDVEPEDIEEMLEDIGTPLINLRCVHNNGYINYYVNGKVEESDDSDTEVSPRSRRRDDDDDDDDD